MKTKHLLRILMLFLCAFSLMSCLKDDEEGRKVTDYKEYVLTVASKKIPGVRWSDGANYLSDVYAVKKENAQEWESWGYIGGFEWERGYEYKVRISETSYLDHSMGQPAWTEYDLLEILSKEKKDSEGVLPHFIPEWFYKELSLPEYRYAVEADNKELIEEDLEANSILPLDYHYLIYGDGKEGLKWVGIQDDMHVLGAGLIKSINSNPEELPEVYKLLPPKGQVQGYMEWTLLDEQGKETVYPSFDVFLGYSAKSRSAGPTLNLLNFYKDLTSHYKDKYPQAGVKAVVVSYAIAMHY